MSGTKRGMDTLRDMGQITLEGVYPYNRINTIIDIPLDFTLYLC